MRRAECGRVLHSQRGRWNQGEYAEADYDSDKLDRFPTEAGFPGKSSAPNQIAKFKQLLQAAGRKKVVIVDLRPVPFDE